jgi:hypothetical protein
MAKMPLTPRPQKAVLDPIRWSADSKTVDAVQRYCEEQYHITSEGRYGEARREILGRIYGNVINPTHRAYNGQQPFGQVSFDLVARELTKHCDDTPAGKAKKAGYLTALSSEWDTLHGYFQGRFIKPSSD